MSAVSMPTPTTRLIRHTLAVRCLQRRWVPSSSRASYESKSPTLRRWGPTHDALDHHGRDAREYGLGHWGRQNIANRVRRWRLPSRLDVATAEHIPELPRLLM